MLASKQRAVERRRAICARGAATIVRSLGRVVPLPFSSLEAIPGESFDGRTATARECQDALDALPQEVSVRR
jgi:hypothetical protein